MQLEKTYTQNLDKVLNMNALLMIPNLLLTRFPVLCSNWALVQWGGSCRV